MTLHGAFGPLHPQPLIEPYVKLSFVPVPVIHCYMSKTRRGRHRAKEIAQLHTVEKALHFSSVPQNAPAPDRQLTLGGIEIGESVDVQRTLYRHLES